MFESVLRDYLLCPTCLTGPLRPTAFERNGDDILNGIAVCSGCAGWYRIEDGLLELLPASLRDADRDLHFSRRFVANWDGPLPTGKKTAAQADAAAVDAHKLEQKQFYDDDAVQYETQMVKLAFWKAFDREFIDDIRGLASVGDGVLLEIGCGTGRFSLPLASTYRQILSFDISEAMVRTALKKRAELGSSVAHTCYFVADAERIPVRSAVADVALFSGILHHVERPAEVIAHMARALKSGGRFIGNENNRSAFRPAFDFLMRLRKLWNEKAHEEHFIMSGSQLDNWFASAGVRNRSWTSVFLPPHFYNLLPDDGVVLEDGWHLAVDHVPPFAGHRFLQRLHPRHR